MQAYKYKQLALLIPETREKVLSCRSVEELNNFKNEILMTNQTMEVNADKKVHRISLSVGYLDLLTPVAQDSLAAGNVDLFLDTLEKEIQTSLKALMKTAIPKINVDKLDTEDPLYTQLPL